MMALAAGGENVVDAACGFIRPWFHQEDTSLHP
jgi:hypothetical protein